MYSPHLHKSFLFKIWQYLGKTRDSFKNYFNVIFLTYIIMYYKLLLGNGIKTRKL